MFAVVETLEGDPQDLLRRFDEVVSSNPGSHAGRLVHLCLESASGITIINVFDNEAHAVAHSTDKGRLARVNGAGLDPLCEVARVHRSRGLPEDVG